MDNKEQAREKAKDKVWDLVSVNFSVAMEEKEDQFIVKKANGDWINFPFTDLKDGDACLIDQSDYGFMLYYYYKGEFYYCYKDGEFKDTYRNFNLITKTGFNILEHLEEK